MYTLLEQPPSELPAECVQAIKEGISCPDINPDSEFTTLMRRLGALFIFTPYVPDWRWELRLTKKDERKVINMLVKMGADEPGENWVNESLDCAPNALLPRPAAQQHPHKHDSNRSPLIGAPSAEHTHWPLIIRGVRQGCTRTSRRRG